MSAEEREKLAIIEPQTVSGITVNSTLKFNLQLMPRNYSNCYLII